MSRPPTTIAVREATVGPESGTNAVSWGATSTSSTSIPSSAATSCGKIVLVPWPISVDAVRTRIRPSSVSSRLATEPIFTSPEPVKPAPCQASASPMPRRRPCARGSRDALGRRPRPDPLELAGLGGPVEDLDRGDVSRSTWPVGVTSPGRYALRRRSASGDMPSASAAG